MNKFLVLLIGVGAILLFIFTSQNNLQQTENRYDEVHYHAGFQVYRDNELVDFSGFEYMKIEPCSIEEHENLTAEEEQLEKAHLHDNIGDVVHVHREGATWGDLFKNINYDIGEVDGYVDGELVENVLEKRIEPYESIVFVKGEVENLGDKLATRVSEERIMEAESVSENCGS